MRLAIKDKDGFKYWEYILFYLDDVLCKIDKPMHNMRDIQSNSKLKDYKMEKPYVYLSA